MTRTTTPGQHQSSAVWFAADNAGHATGSAPALDHETGAATFTAYSESIAPFRRARRLFIPLACDVADTTVAQAIEDATGLIETLGLYPGDLSEVTDLFAEITRWADREGYPFLLNLVGPVAERLICDLTGVSDLQFLPTGPNTRNPGRVVKAAEDQAAEQLAVVARERDRAHHVRNALIALRGGVVWVRHRSRKLRHSKDSLALGLPDLPNRAGSAKSRPLLDDEILLSRILIEIDLLEEAPPRGILGGLVAETGISCIESTALTTTALNHRHAPTTITRPGAWGFEERTVDLSDYVRHAMPRALKHLRHTDDTLTYAGDVPGTDAAHASLGAQLDRHLRRAGLTDTDLTPKSINLWRPKHALLNGDDFATVLNYHGGRTINLLEQLHLKADHADVDEGWITLIEQGDDPLEILVRAHQYNNDKSTTLKGNRSKQSRHCPGCQCNAA